MLRYIGHALAYHWESQKSSPANLIAGVFGMVLNNLLFLQGAWLLLFAGKPANQPLIPLFLALWAATTTAWGLINFLTGGLSNLGQLIENGGLESMLATPRHPLWLVACSASHPTAIGDILQGLASFGLLFWLTGPAVMTATLLMAFASYVAFLGVFIIAGSSAFFLPKGSGLATLMVDACLHLSTYPSSHILVGRQRLLLYCTPALFTTLLPLRAMEYASILNGLTALVAALLFTGASIATFNFGASRYRSANFVGMSK